MAALVTGGAQGIGLAISRALLRNSYKVALLDYNSAVGSSASEELKKEFGKDKVLFVHCDVTKNLDLAAAYSQSAKTFGGIDVVCNNAGIGDEVNIRKTIAVNLTAVIESSRLALQYMSTNKGARGGVIVNISSAAGLFPEAMVPVYTATKQGVVGFSKSIQGWYDSDGIRVNCVCPAFTDTAMFRQMLPSSGGHAGQNSHDVIKALGVMSPECVSDAVLKTIQDTTMNGELLLVRHMDGMNIVEVRVKKTAKL